MFGVSLKEDLQLIDKRRIERVQHLWRPVKAVGDNDLEVEATGPHPFALEFPQPAKFKDQTGIGRFGVDTRLPQIFSG